MELEEGEDVEKINQAAKGWGQKRRQVACSWDCVPGLSGVGLQKEWRGKEASKKKAGTSTAWFHFQSGVVFLRAVGPGWASFRF